MKKYYIALFLFLFSFSTFAQEVKNIRVAQTGNRINILFDLLGTGKAFKVSLFYTTDNGQTWLGPLKSVSGDISNLNVPSNDNRIVWDALSEKGEFEGDIQFRVSAEFGKGTSLPMAKTDEARPWLNDPQFRKHKNAKGFWLTTAIVSTGVGGYSYFQSNKNYDKYVNASHNAEELREKIKTLDTVYPIAFGAAGLSFLIATIHNSQQNKIKRNFSVTPYTTNTYTGLSLSLNF